MAKTTTTTAATTDRATDADEATSRVAQGDATQAEIQAEPSSLAVIAEANKLDAAALGEVVEAFEVEVVDMLGEGDEAEPLYDAAEVLNAVAAFAAIVERIGPRIKAATEQQLRDSITAELRPKIEAEARKAAAKALPTAKAEGDAISLGVSLDVEPFEPPELSDKEPSAMSKAAAKAELDRIHAAHAQSGDYGRQLGAVRKSIERATLDVERACRRISAARQQAANWHRGQAGRIAELEARVARPR